MADWGTVTVAAITASAALGASAITQIFASKHEKKRHVRADKEAFRAKVEEMYAEIDNLHGWTLSNLSLSSSILNDKSRTLPSIATIGKLRALTSLYFPCCESAFSNLKGREKNVREALKIGFMAQPSTDSLYKAYLVGMNDAYSRLCDDLLNCMEPIAIEAGRAIREA